MSGYTVSSFTDPLLAYQHIQENPEIFYLIIWYNLIAIALFQLGANRNAGYG